MKIQTISIVVIIFVLNCLSLCGCKKHTERDELGVINDNIVCEDLYQINDTFTNAYKFVNAPREYIEDPNMNPVKGELVGQDKLDFANKVFSIRKTKDVDLFISLLSKGTIKQLSQDSNKHMVHHHIKSIKDGTFLYGEHDVKFFAAFREFIKSDAEWESLLKYCSFPDMPTHILNFWHYHEKPNSLIIGSTFYLVEQDDSYKIVPETLKYGEVGGP